VPQPEMNGRPVAATNAAVGAPERGAPYFDGVLKQRFQFLAPFDRDVFRREYAKSFKGVAKANMASFSDLEVFLSFLEQDARITDIRWMAYMLGTAFVETSKTTRVMRADGKSSKKVWLNFHPDGEAGKGAGRDYYLPVKVFRQNDGSALVSEQDGDQWTVNSGGGRRQVQQLGVPNKSGAPANSPAHPSYSSAPGTERQYYGRGYVQLTWWFNYVAAGVVLGSGMTYLFEPDLVCAPKTAYEIMSKGMLSGGIFANGHRLNHYFVGSHSDYRKARAMVNPKDKLNEVTAIALLFERVLLAAHPRWVGSGLRMPDGVEQNGGGRQA
jgi:hypothetical protein